MPIHEGCPTAYDNKYSEGNYDQPLAITRGGETILRIYNYIKEKQHG